MSIDLCWYDERHDIIVTRFEAGWNWEEAAEAADVVTHLLSGVPEPVAVILECHGTYIPPDMLNHFDVIARSSFFAHPNRQSVTMVLGSSFLRTFADVFVRVHRELGCKVYMARSINEAVSAVRGNVSGKLPALNFQPTARH